MEQGSQWEAGEGDARGSIATRGAATLLRDGLGADGSMTGAVSGETEEGLSFAGEMELGGGLFARARALPADDPEAVLVVVMVGASGQFGLSTQGEKDSASLGMKGSIGGEATSTTARVVPRTVAAGLVGAWEQGDAGPWFDTFGSLAAIGRFASEGDVLVADLAPGEFVRKTSAVDAAVCLPAAWRRAAVSAGASHHGERVASAEALADDTVAVEVSFDTTVTFEADGTVQIGAVALGAGGSNTSRAGVTYQLVFDRVSEAHRAEEVLEVASARALERAAAEMPWAVWFREERTGEDSAMTPHAGAPVDAGLTTRHTSAWDERVGMGEGLDASFEGRSGCGFDVGVGGHDLLGAGHESSLSARAQEGQVTGRLEIATSETAPTLPRFGVTPAASWPAVLRGTFIRDSDALFALDLSERDIEQIVFVRVWNEHDWELCGQVAGVAAFSAWARVGDTLRNGDPPEEWVEAAGMRVATLAMGMRELAVFAASVPGSGDVFLELTQRFGVQSGQEADYDSLGTVESWPPGAEDLHKRFEAALVRKETFAEDLAAAADADAGRELHHAIALPLNAITVAIPGLEAGDPYWKPMMLEQIAQIRTEVEWDYAMFQRRHGECDPEGSELEIAVADAEERETFVLLGTMRSYQAVEQGLFDEYRGRPDGLVGFQRDIQALYRTWHETYSRLASLPAGDARGATPDRQQYEEVLVTLVPDYPSERTRLMTTALSSWRESQGGVQ